ncbi:MAG: 4'-phosphopantetheinyl transferase family protein [Bacteroidota bacterium]
MVSFSLIRSNKENYRMPLCSFTRISKHSAHLLWHIDEPEEVLLRANGLSPLTQSAYKQITHPRKRREWLAARLALKNLMTHLGQPHTAPLQKDAWGRPYWAHSSWHISMAHCFPFAFAAADQQHAIGVDIQLPCKQLQAVKEKFLLDKEMQDSGDDLEKLCIYWCAKEAIYKAYGGKGLSLKQDINVHAFTKLGQGVIWGSVGSQRFAVHYNFYKAHVLVWCREVSATNRHT